MDNTYHTAILQISLKFPFVNICVLNHFVRVSPYPAELCVYFNYFCISYLNCVICCCSPALQLFFFFLSLSFCLSHADLKSRSYTTHCFSKPFFNSSVRIRLPNSARRRPKQLLGLMGLLSRAGIILHIRNNHGWFQ